VEIEGGKGGGVDEGVEGILERERVGLKDVWGEGPYVGGGGWTRREGGKGDRVWLEGEGGRVGGSVGEKRGGGRAGAWKGRRGVRGGMYGRCGSGWWG